MALEKDTITASCLRPGFLPELGHQVVFLGLGRMQHGARQPMGQIMSGVHVCLGDETCKNMYDSIPPNHLLFFFATEQSDGSMLGMKDVDENQVGMAQNVESDTSLPYDIQSFW